MGSLLALAAFGILSALFTNDLNKSTMREQQNWNEEMMDKQNAYNLPSEQLERLKSAGINPNASMGVGTIQNSSASVNPSSLLPAVDPSISMGNLASNMMSAFNSQQGGLSDMTFREATLDKIQQESNQLRASATNLGLSSDAQLILNKYIDQKELLALRGQSALNELTYSQIEQLSVGTDKLRFELEKILPQELQNMITENKVNVLDLDRLIALTANLKADTSLKESQKGLLDEQAITEQFRQSELQEQGALEAVQANEISATLDKILEKYSAEIDNLSENTNLTRQQVWWFVIDRFSDFYKRTLGGVTKGIAGSAPFGK